MFYTQTLIYMYLLIIIIIIIIIIVVVLVVISIFICIQEMIQSLWEVVEAFRCPVRISGLQRQPTNQQQWLFV